MIKNVVLWGFLAGSLLSAATYRVGPTQEYQTIKAVASKTLVAGDEVLIDPGIYKEAVFWRGGSLSGPPVVVRGTGSQRTVIDGTGVSVLGASGIPRALFQVEGLNFVFENFELRNARNGQNGAGVRVLGTAAGTQPSEVVFRNLLVRWNDMGFMSSQNNNILVEHSEIAWNGAPEYNGFSHNFYLDGNKAVVRYCYLHDSTTGEVFKARSRYVELLYNYIADAHDRIDYGDTTKEVGFAEGPFTGLPNAHAVMIGNVLVKRGNGYAFLDFGPEGSTPARNGTLFMINNTVIREADVPHWFLRMGHAAEKAVLFNNIFWSTKTTAFARGAGSVNITDGSVTGANNWFSQGMILPSGLTGSIFGTAAGSDPGFIDRIARDYRLKHNSLLLDAGASDVYYLDENGVEHRGLPASTYLPHMQVGPRIYAGNPDLGAYELSPDNRLFSSDTVSGRVLLANGQPSVRHSVTLQGSDPRSVITNDQGVYKFVSLHGAESAVVQPWIADLPSKKVQNIVADFVTAPAHTVQGTITSIGKNEPIPGVLVYLNGRDSRWTKTDATGYFKFPLVPGGTVNTLVLRHASITNPSDVTRTLGEINTDTTLDIKVDLKYSILVSVRDPNNGTIIGVALELTGTGIATPILAASNTSGNWTFSNLSTGGTFQIRVVNSPELYPQSVFTIADLQKNETLRINGPQMVTLTGTVRYQNGQPVPGAIVRASGTQTYNNTAGADGRYLFNFFLLGGAYRLTATSLLAQFPAVAAEVTYLANQNPDVDVVGTALYTITVQVVNATTGAPMPLIPVRMRGAVVKDINTDNSGLARFTNVPEGSIVTVYPDRPQYTFAPPSVELSPVSGAQTIVFRATPQ